MPVPPTRRGRERKELILEAAARLVAGRGFHAVGVTDIGAAAGVSGPALYRHFANKAEILVALLDRVLDDLLATAEEAGRDPAPGAGVLRTLIAAHTSFALAERSLLAVYSQEFQNLPAEARRRLLAKQRRYVDVWVEAYRRQHPGVPESNARIRVEAVFGLINSVPDLPAEASDELVGPELRRLAEAALLA